MKQLVTANMVHQHTVSIGNWTLTDLLGLQYRKKGTVELAILKVLIDT